MDVRRGNLVTIVLPGDFGKPRPALIIQSDLFNATHPTVTVLPISSDLVVSPVCRITVEPSVTNGLRQVSQIMVDKLMTTRREKLGQYVGRLEDETLLRVNRALAVWVGIT